MRTIFFFVCSVISAASFASDSVVSVGGHLTREEFQTKVESGIAVLTKSAPLRVEDAVLLVRISNTLFLADSAKTKKELEFESLMGFSAAERLGRTLGESIPNRGMGLYFKKHDLHWGGAVGNIRDRDAFAIEGTKTKKEPNQAPEPTAPSGRGSS